MARKRLLTILATGLMLAACKDEGPGGTSTWQSTDPTGDVFGTGSVQHDLTGMTITRDTGGIDIVLDFAANVVSPVSGSGNAMVGVIDFDTDQDSTTGDPSTVDAFRPGTGSTGLGVDYLLDLFVFNTDSSFNVFSTASGVTGTAKPNYNGRRVTVRIPRGRFGNDDVFLNAAVVVGTGAEPTDIAPNNGHLRVGGTTVTAARSIAALRQRWTARRRVWGERQ